VREREPRCGNLCQCRPESPCRDCAPRQCSKMGCNRRSVVTVWGSLSYEACEVHRAEIERLTEND